MFGSDVSKYGLATHLAIAAGLPVAMSQFVSADFLGIAMLWTALYAAVWVVLEPAVFSSETVSLARNRVMRGLLRDPLAWFLLFSVLFCFLRWLNSGVKLAFDAETGVWQVQESAVSLIPASSGEAGFLPFASILVFSIVAIGIKHALGRNGRLWFGVCAPAIAAVGGMTAVVCAGLGMEPYKTMALAGFGADSFAGTLYAIYLIIAVVCGIEAEEHAMSKARLVFAWAVAGNAAAAFMFLPTYLSLAYGTIAVLFAAFASVLAKRRKSVAVMARAIAMFSFGIVIALFALIIFSDKDVSSAKENGLEYEKAFPAAEADRDAVLRRVSKDMWLTHPWSGVGVGAFKIHAPFNVTDDDWSVLPPEPKHGSNMYFTMLAERGIVGMLLWLTGLGFLLWFWIWRFIGACKQLSGRSEGRSFAVNLPAVAWAGPVVLATAAADAWFSTGGNLPPLLAAAAAAMPLSAASFPKHKPKTGGAEETKVEK